MGRIGISYHDIADTVPKLIEQRKTPSIDNIREYLGTGSKSTIAKLLREWKAQQGLRPEDNSHLPPDLTEVVKLLWDRLRQKADTQINSEREQAEEKIRDSQQKYHQEHKLLQELQQSYHGLEEQLHQQANENKQLKAALIIEQQEKVKLTERVASFEARRQENIAENERLHQLLKHAQDSLEHYQTATQQVRQEQSLLIEKQRNEYEQKIIQWQTQAQSASHEKSLIEAQYQQLNQAYAKLEEAHKTLVSEHSPIKNVYKNLQQENEKLCQQYQEKVQQLETKQHTIIELQVTLKTETIKTVNAEEALKKANDKIESLRHDMQFIAQEKANLEGQLKQLLPLNTTQAK